MRAYAQAGGEAHNLTREQELELELTKKSGLLEEERKKALDTLDALEKVRDARKGDQSRLAELRGALEIAEARVKELEAALQKIASIAIAPGARGAEDHDAS